jgi:hypothetical protein
MFFIRARADQGQEGYVLTIASDVYGASTQISVLRGTALPVVIEGGSVPDFIADMSDGKEHVFDLGQLNGNALGPLKIRMLR